MFVRLLLTPCYNALCDLSEPTCFYSVKLLASVSYIKGGIQVKGIWKQDPEANIWSQEEWEWGVEKAPQWGTS